jgi:hypothetical protein
MADFAKMYRRPFNAQTDAIRILQKAQQETEEMYIEAPDPDIRLLPSDGKDDEGDEEIHRALSRGGLSPAFFRFYSMPFCAILMRQRNVYTNTQTISAF